MMDVVRLYCDGGVIGANPSTIGGTWAWCAVNTAGDRLASDSGVFHGATQHIVITNNMSEYAAAIRGLEAMDAGWSGLLCSDSQITLGRLCWGWQTNGLLPSWIARAERALARLGRIEPLLLQGHPTKADLARGTGAKRGFPVSAHNVWCDQACTAAGRTYLEQRGAA